MSHNFDVIIIGSGPAGVHSAYPLVEAGLRVGMIDGGIEDTHAFDTIDESFEEIRLHRADQHAIFLGNDLSGSFLTDDTDHVHHMFAGRFSYVAKNTETFLPVTSQGMQLVQTLAKGGMSEVWGGVSDTLDDEELRAVGLPVNEMHTHYQRVIDQIGISGQIQGYTTQPTARVSTHAQKLMNRFEQTKRDFQQLELTLHPSILALLTEQKQDRESTEYADTDYWTNARKSLYRARFTLEQLMQKENFQYIPERIATKLYESNDSVTIETTDFSQQSFTYTASYVVCAVGALNTVRILLKSFELYNTKINITSKAHIITPCVDLKFLGKKEHPEKHSLCQLILESTRKINGFSASYSQLYTYKSLLLFKLLNFSPLSAPESLAFLALLTPSLILADSRFPGAFHHTKTCSLIKTSTEEQFTIEYSTSEEEKMIIKKEMKIVLKGLRKLGLLPLKHVPLPEGSSAHYAGGVPISQKATEPLSADIHGKLHGSQRIYIGDASLWRAIPSKPPTLTIMANANRIGTNLAQNIRNLKL